jgi:CRISPR-associated protein Csm3
VAGQAKPGRGRVEVGDFDFQGKYLIYADMVCKTGLHIGGTEEGFEIGGLSNPVIRDPLTERPYMPGSSLKGKMRSLVEWAIPGKHPGKEGDRTCVEYMLEQAKAEREKEEQGKEQGEKKKEIEIPPCDCGECDVCAVFGCSAETGGAVGPTRLTVRDAMPRRETVAKWETTFGKGIYTEVKTENSVGRITSIANPRPMERVPRGSEFRVEMVFDLYQKGDEDKLKMVFQALKLLEDSALGGSGTRGSGKVKFRNFKVVKRGVSYYTKAKEKPQIDLKGNDTPFQIVKHFDCIFNGSGDGK